MKSLWIVGFSILFLTILTGCMELVDQPLDTTEGSGTEQNSSPVLTSDNTRKVGSEALHKTVAQFNRGAALLEQYKYVEAAKAFEAVLDTAPDWTAARFNLGLAYFNMQEDQGAQNYLEMAKQTFEKVLQSEPNHLHARFCLGLYYQHLARNKEALEYFRAVSQADAKDPYVLYKYAESLISLDRIPEGTEMLEKVISIDPGFVSAVYRLAIQYQRARQPEKAKPLFDRFRELKNMELTGGTFTVLKSYGTIGKYYMALGADNLPLISKPTSVTRVLFSPELEYIGDETSAWKHSAGKVSLPGLAAGDLDRDGDIDLCITSLGPEASTSLWYNDGAGAFSQNGELALQGLSPCFGDVDNDGDLDLWLGCAGADRYFENDGKGKFSAAQLADVAGERLLTHCARLLDLDSDGDLDLLAMRYKGGDIPPADTFESVANALYNNNRDGSFPDMAEKLGLALKDISVAGVVYDDFDNDRDLDLVIFPTGDSEPIGWVNDRIWQYHTLDAGTMGISTKGVIAAISGDPDGDGDRDLLVFTDSGLQLFINQGGFRFVLHQDFADRCGRIRATGGQFADMDNDGDLDIVLADAFRRDGGRGPSLLINDRSRDQFTDVAEADPGNLFAAIRFEGNASCVVADFTADGKCDVLLAPIGCKPMLIRNVTSGGHWIEIDLSGLHAQDNKSRSNNSAIGACVDIKTGTISQQHIVGATSGQVAMPPHRIHAGLGPYPKVDWLRITWPDAVMQAELELPADQVVAITELQRKTSSCPHLFAWDGSHFRFISDFGGMGGIGYLVSPGVYAPPDPTEYLPVPDLKPLDGEYVLQAMEPIEEIVYFDEAKLIAVDHPQDTEVYPHEMMAINAYPPPFELFCFRDSIDPVQAVDHRGVDVTDEVLRVDRRYAGTTELDHRFTGVAKEHFVEFDFGDRLGAVPSGARLVLFFTGWVEYGYSATNFAASQAGVNLHAPSIHALRDGQWVELFNEVGYPAGIRHTMTLEVTGKVLPGDRRFRISTNMELYWDRIFIAPVLEDAGLRVTEIPVKSADLHFLGYPREYSPDGSIPLLYDYGSVDRTIPWKMMAGKYTRYGPVTELLDKADDCYVVMGPGEELTLRFPADAFGSAPQGYTRSFIFKSDSYCKDMDLYSAYPDTVAPLPFHGMSSYPYPETEKYPDNPKHKQYHAEFNTREVLGSNNQVREATDSQ